MLASTIKTKFENITNLTTDNIPPRLVNTMLAAVTVNYMALDLEKMSQKLGEALANMTQEEIDKYFPPDTRPKGWLSIEEYLPMM